LPVDGAVSAELAWVGYLNRRIGLGEGLQGQQGKLNVSRANSIRRFFARQEDPYAGGDLENAQRIGVVLWSLLVLLTLGLLLAEQPVNPSKGAGWAIAAVLIALGAVLVVQNRRRRIVGWEWLLATAYWIVAGLAVMQWVGGGVNEPYEALLLLPVVFVAATQPPRQIAAFMAFVLLALLSPFFYDGWDWDAAGGSLASFVIWCALAVGGSLLMTGVRAQRLSHAAEEAAARREARIDSLTGLHNRRAFDETLSTEIERARRLDLPLSLAMVDIENFKEVNDRWSYAEGDRCLREVAEALRENLRQPDLCFRWGGDEFALILTGTTADETDPIAERLHAEVAATCKRPDEAPIQIRFAVTELRDGMSARELVEAAGLALTSAKFDAAR
jgi:diguanylate cyclase (GGDEF)-like protein